ncbi:hypothetical protein D3C78_1760710 [compost metagenome]
MPNSAGCRLKGPSGSQRMEPLTLRPTSSTSTNIRMASNSMGLLYCCQRAIGTCSTNQEMPSAITRNRP